MRRPLMSTLRAVGRAAILSAASGSIAIAIAAAAATATAGDRLGEIARAVPEPGVSLGPGRALLPVIGRNLEGRPARLDRAAVTVEVDGRPLRDVERVTYGNDPDADPSALFVAVDPSALVGHDLAAWGAALEKWVSEPGAKETRAVWILGARRPKEIARSGEGPVAPGLVADRLASGEGGRLWDGLLVLLDRLSGPDLPDRRVLLVVANGIEARESVHPVATCVDAADTARVAVHALAPDARRGGGGLSRLRTLAERTGGVFLVAPERRPAETFSRSVEVVRSAVGLRLRGLPETLPLRVSVRATAGATSADPGWVRPRRALGLSGGARPPWLAIALAVAVAGGLGGFLVVRFRPIGRLVVTAGAPEAAAGVDRRGIRLGAAPGNDLILDRPSVSRKHAVVKVEGGEPTIVDLRSANGTKVNGRPVRQARLNDGDRILLADEVELVYQSRRRRRRRG